MSAEGRKTNSLIDWGKQNISKIEKMEKEKKELERMNYSIYISGLDQCVDKIPTKEMSSRLIENDNLNSISEGQEEEEGK
jgi:hypothetical protein